MPLRSRFVPHLIAALGLLVASACESPVVPAATPPPQEAAAARTTATPVSVTADLGAALSVKPMSGLLHGLGATSPIDSLIAPLRPATWRLGSFEHYDRVRRTGARVIMVLSDLWGYQRTGSVRWPYDDYAVWERFVDSVAVAHAGRPVVWDVWNEPDIDFFWPQGDSAQARFHETYRRAARVLRDRLGPDALLSGPSYSEYFPDRIKAFVDFCGAAGCEVNVLSWHELNPAHTMDIAAHLTEARAGILAGAAGQAVRMRELHVGETVGLVDTHRPGAALMALAQLEAGKADANARACWNDRSGELTCFNNSLDGLLTSGGARRRAAWWAYKSYADGMDARVASTSTDPRVAVLASARTTRSAPVQVLVGAWSHDGAPATSALSVRLTRLSSVPALAGRSQVRVRTWRIPNSGETSMDRFTATSDRLVSVSGDAIAVSVSLAMYEGALLTVE